jgi:hypothetical protein
MEDTSLKPMKVKEVIGYEKRKTLEEFLDSLPETNESFNQLEKSN